MAAFAREQELEVIDSALSYLVRDKIIDDDTRLKYIREFGDKVLNDNATFTPA